MRSNLAPVADSCPTTPPGHPAEAFLRSHDLQFTPDPNDPALLILPVDLGHGPMHAVLHRHPAGELLIFHVSLPSRPSGLRPLRETAQLCRFFNSVLPAGRFAVDELDGAVTFRNGHFYGSGGLDTTAFTAFFAHCLQTVQEALLAFRSVAEGQSAASEAFGAVLPPSDS